MHNMHRGVNVVKEIFPTNCEPLFNRKTTYTQYMETSSNLNYYMQIYSNLWIWVCGNHGHVFYNYVCMCKERE